MNLLSILITIVISLFFSVILVAKIKVGIALSFVFLFVPVFWLISKQFDEKKVVRIFIIIYPLLPALAGISLGAGVPVLRAHRVVTLLLLIFLMSKGLLARCYSDFLKSNIFTFNVILVIASMAVTSFFSASFQSTMFFTLSLVFEFFIFTVVIFSTFKTDDDIELLINSFLISGVILSLFGIFEKISGYNFYSTFGVFDDQYSSTLSHQIRDGGIRIQASFEHSISYAAYLVTILPLFLYKFRKQFTQFNASVLLLMTAILASQSRSGMLGAVIVFLLYCVFVERKNMVLILILSIPVLIYNASSIAQYLINLNPLTTTSSEMADSTSARGDQLIMLFEYIKQNIVFGFGMVSAKIGSIDNFYLLYTYQFGFAGLFSYLSLFLSVISKPFRTKGFKVSKDLRMIVMLFAIFAFSIINMFVALWSFQFIYYAYIGIIARLLYNRRGMTGA